MPHHGEWIQTAMLFLVASGIVVPLFQHAKLGAAIGFLVAGIVVGPFGLGRFIDDYAFLSYVTIDDAEQIAAIGELGVIFLLFTLGLEISFSRLWSLRRFVLGAGLSQIMISALVIGAIAYAFGNETGVSIVVGLAFALSSTAIVMQLIYESHRVATQVGRLSMSILLMQDIMVIPILFVVGILAAGQVGNAGIALLEALALAAAAIVAILVAGRYALKPVLRLTASAKSRDLFVAVTLLVIGAIALATQAAGLSMALGAFLAGMLLSESEYRHQIEVDIEPFRGLLLGLFFMSVGMGIDPLAIFDQLFLLAMSAVGLFVIKATILFFVLWFFGVDKAGRSETALLLGQAGEFVFVVLAVAVQQGVVEREGSGFFILVASVTMMMTPGVAWLGRKIAARLEDGGQGGTQVQAAHDDLEGHVVVGGFGRVGRLVVQVLEAENVPYVALDMDAKVVTEERTNGHHLFYGDASRKEFLQRIGAQRARAFIVTLDDPKAAERMVKNARKFAPDAMIFARAKDANHARSLKALETTGVVPEAVEGSLRLAGRLLEGLGFPDEAVVKRIATVRDMEEHRLE